MPANLSLTVAGVSGAAATLGLIPLLWVSIRKEHRPGWGWLAFAFGLSFVADVIGFFGGGWWVSAVYPVSQAGLIAALLLPKKTSALFVTVLVWAGIVSLQLHQRPEVLLHTVSWLGLAALLYRQPLGRLREALFCYFGLGWVAWLSYCLAPGWESWLVFQGIRALGIGLFCWAQQERVTA